VKLQTARLRSPREKRRADREARRREDALAAAAGVFAAKGYHDAQMTEIAAAAELSRATLYALFAGKQELYEEVISEAAAAIGEAVRGDVAELDDPGERLLCVIDSLFARYEANQALLRIYAAGTHGLPFKIRDALGEATLQRFVQFTSWVGELAQQAQRAGLLAGLDPEVVGVSLMGTVTTTAARWIESSPERPLSQAAPAVRAMFQRLLGEEETG